MPSGTYIRNDPVARFWSCVDKNGPTMPNMDTPCWVWTGSKGRRDYGQLRWYGRTDKAHRVAWMIQNGPIPGGSVIMHECDNPPCVRHIKLGTQQDNVDDAMSKGRMVTWRERGAPCRQGEATTGAKLTEADVMDIRTSLLSAPALADKYGVFVNTIRSVRRGRTWRHLPLGVQGSTRGSRSALAKINEDQVREIRSMRRSGMSAADISKETHIPQSTIFGVLSGRTWSHVEDNP